MALPAVLRAVFLAFFIWVIQIRADDAAEDGVSVEDDGDEKKGGEAQAKEGDEGEAETDEEKAAAYMDSAKDLNEKLAQLKSLLEARGEGADPELKDRLKKLQDQLSGLGLDDLGLAGEATPGSNRELTEFLTGCVMMTVRRSGVQRSSTISALKRLADGKLPPSEAAKLEFWKMAAVCIADFTEDELKLMKEGKMQVLPKVHVEEAKKPGAEAKVTEIDAEIWAELKIIAKSVLGSMAGDKEKPPVYIGLLAGIPVLLAVAFLAKKFKDMQEEKDKKGNKKREGKKSK